MADDSWSYCDSEEEVFFGKPSKQELLKIALLGHVNDSPAVQCNTPRMAATNCPNLPDVLKGSSEIGPVVKNKEISAEYEENDNMAQSTHFPSVNSSFNENDDDIIVIDLDGQDDSVQIISDDESFLLNEERLSLVKSDCEHDKADSNKDDELLNSSASKGELSQIKIVSNEHFENKTFPGTSEIVNSYSLSEQEFDSETTATAIDYGNSSIVLSSDNYETEGASYESSKLQQKIDLLHQDISAESIIFNDSNSLCYEESQDNIMTAEVSKSGNGNELSSSKLEPIIPEETMVLGNISPPSSVTAFNQTSAHLESERNNSVGLELVDNLGTPIDISRQSLYKSCFSEGSSYYTARNVDSTNPPASERPPSSFYNYRETANDSVLSNEDENETNFEIVLQNHQNSFTSKIPVQNVTENTTEQSKRKFISKLPLLQPPKLVVNSNTLKINNYKCAKNTGKSVPNTISARSKTVESLNSFKPYCSSLKTKVTTPNSKPYVKVSNKAKTPFEHQTPIQNLASNFSRGMKSETKSSKTLIPTPKNLKSSEKKERDKNMPLLRHTDGYKNIISPVHAYITGTPIVLQKKANFDANEETQLGNSGKKNLVSHIPMKMHTPLTRTSNAVQKLDYKTVQDQENIEPNYNRDTLPPRVLKTASAVFLNPEPPRKYVPKIGETMQKLLDTPRPKVVVHQGRVKELPSARGLLVSGTDASSPQQQPRVSCVEQDPDQYAGRISVRVVKPAEKSDFFN